jgi:hypothetical protein
MIILIGKPAAAIINIANGYLTNYLFIILTVASYTKNIANAQIINKLPRAPSNYIR